MGRRSFTSGVVAGLLAAALAIGSRAGAVPIPTTVGDWEVVQVGADVSSLQAMGDGPGALYAGTVGENIAIGTPGNMTVHPVKGALLGIVDYGLPSATAYFEVFEGWNDTDFNGDGDRYDYQLRYAVNSTMLVAHPSVRNSWGSDTQPFVAPTVLTQFRGSDSTMVRMYGAGRVEITAAGEMASSMRQQFRTGELGGVGFYIKPDGTIINTGLRGVVRGLAGDVPVVAMLTSPPGVGMPTFGETVLATTPPKVLIPPSPVFAQSFQTRTALWLTLPESAHVDFNGDGDLADQAFCELGATGITRCLSSNLGLANFGAVAPAGPSGIIIKAIDVAAASPQYGYLYVARGAAPVPIADEAVVVSSGDTSLVVAQDFSTPDEVRYRWHRVDSRGVSSPLLSQSAAEYIPTGLRELGGGRFVINLPETSADLNGDGDREDIVSHLLGTTGEPVNLGVSGFLTGYFDPPPINAFEDGGPLLIGVMESEQSADLNGDGDRVDFVVGVLEGTKWTNLRIANGDDNLYPALIPSISRTGRMGELFTGLAEAAQGDTNADGDSNDRVGVLIRRRSPALGLVNPTRLLDTRTGVGYTGPKPVARQTVVVDVAGKAGLPPTGVAAVALNVTVTQATAPGYVTVWGDGTQPGTSNLNVNRVDQTIPNLVFAPVGADGKVRIYTSDGGHLIADVVAWFRTGGAFTPTATPTRLLDTRPTSRIGYSGAKPAGSAVVEVPVAGAAAGQLAVVNVTATDTTAPGYVTVWGSGAMPPTSNLNVTEPGMTIPNLVIAPVGADGKIRIFTSDGTHLIADLFGILAGPAVTATSPNRLLDTRPSAQIGYRGPRPAAGQTVELAVSTPPGQAVILNVTATGVAAPGYVTVWPSGTLPNASNLNPEFADQSIANLVIAPVGPDGKIRLYTSDGTHLIADSFGSLIP